MSHDLLTLPNPTTLGEFIRARRTVLGLSMLELATLLGFSYSCVAHYEANARTPRLPKLKKLAKALRVDVKTLVEFVVK